MKQVLQSSVLLPALLSGLGMWSQSMLWHVWVLNDSRGMGEDLGAFMALAAVAYLLLGVLVAFSLKCMECLGWLGRTQFPVPKAMFTGMALGLVIGLLGVVITAPRRFELDGLHILADVAWQVSELGFGGVLAGLGLFVHRVRENLDREGAL